MLELEQLDEALSARPPTGSSAPATRRRTSPRSTAADEDGARGDILGRLDPRVKPRRRDVAHELEGGVEGLGGPGRGAFSASRIGAATTGMLVLGPPLARV